MGLLFRQGSSQGPHRLSQPQEKHDNSEEGRAKEDFSSKPLIARPFPFTVAFSLAVPHVPKIDYRWPPQIREPLIPETRMHRHNFKGSVLFEAGPPCGLLAQSGHSATLDIHLSSPLLCRRQRVRDSKRTGCIVSFQQTQEAVLRYFVLCLFINVTAAIASSTKPITV